MYNILSLLIFVFFLFLLLYLFAGFVCCNLMSCCVVNLCIFLLSFLCMNMVVMWILRNFCIGSFLPVPQFYFQSRVLIAAAARLLIRLQIKSNYEYAAIKTLKSTMQLKNPLNLYYNILLYQGQVNKVDSNQFWSVIFNLLRCMQYFVETIVWPNGSNS